MNDNSKDELLKICVSRMNNLGLNDQKHKIRLKKEIQEIDSQIEYDYFINLYKQKCFFNKNENNLFVVYLLNLCSDFDINLEPKFFQGEFPDIDVDYLPVIQDYLRNDFCPKTFGRDNVVNIGNYSTFGIKSALLDMARVHGVDRNEIQTITKNLQDRDEEGSVLTWDKAIEITPELAEYCKKYPEVTDSAKRLINRNRGRGKHAGGTVISSIKIDNLVPIMIDTDGNPVSGWTEGLHDQDLQPVGLIKFDILAIKDLLRIASCCKLIKERYFEIKSISAIEGKQDWSDISYLNDAKSIEIANSAKTRGIFQFDSEGMRNLIKAGGVSSFDDLVAYTSLFRPSALKMQMHEIYIRRKKGLEKWEEEVPDCIREVLKKTHGVLAYQEQCMQVLNIVGDIPLIHCEKIRKAISKKNVEEFAKYKQMFLENGSKKTGWPICSDDNKNMTYLFNQIESFSGYGFNACVSEDALIKDKLTNKFLKIKDVVDLFEQNPKQKIILDSFVNGIIVEDEVVNAFFVGEKELFKIELENGLIIKCTSNHEFVCEDGNKHKIIEIYDNKIKIICINASITQSLYGIKSIESIGIKKVFDLTMLSDQHNYLIYDENKDKAAVSGNSHATAYTYLSSRLLYLKAHYPLEFFVTTLSLEADEDKVRSYKREAEHSGITVNRCDINKSNSNYSIIDDQIYIGFSNIKGIGKEVAEEIVSKQPYSCLEDFLTRFGTDKRIVEPLILLGLFKEASPKILLTFYEAYKKINKSNLDRIKRQDKRKFELADSIKSLLKDDVKLDLSEDNLVYYYENYKEFKNNLIDDNFSSDDLYQLLKKYYKSVTSHQQKVELFKSLSFQDWLDELKNEEEDQKEVDQFETEKKYYGFSWQHPIEKSFDYIGDNSFGKFKNDDTIYSSFVECVIVKLPEEKISKKHHKYYYVLVEDEDWNLEVVTFWSEDYKRFEEELNYWNPEKNRGNMLQIRLIRPGKGFKSYTFESPRKNERYKIPDDKSKDYRFKVMR